MITNEQIYHNIFKMNSLMSLKLQFKELNKN